MFCEKCGKSIGNDAMIFGPDCALCADCLQKMQEANVVCPVCGNSSPPDEDLALLLTRANANIQEKIDAPTALVHVCPECHIMFFDDFQYELLKKLKLK